MISTNLAAARMEITSPEHVAMDFGGRTPPISTSPMAFAAPAVRWGQRGPHVRVPRQ
ncbi:MAG: hypothetical protein WKG07_35870 [Hymenobacter sp.]